MSRSIRMELPSLAKEAKEGWLRPLRKSRRSLLRAQTGWFVPATYYRKLNEPPRPRLSKEGAIYLMARHPSFAKEGSSIRMLRGISGSLCFHQPGCFACRGQDV